MSAVTWLGVKRVRFSSLVLPGDFKGRMTLFLVNRELAGSIEDVGLIHLPVVEWKTKRLIAGTDRIAALRCLWLKDHPEKAATPDGEMTVEVRAVEGDPKALGRLRVIENLRRRDENRAALLDELKRLHGEGPIEEEPDDAQFQNGRSEITRQKSEPEPAPLEVPKKKKRGRPKTASVAARDKAAADVGLTPDAARMVEARGKAKANGARQRHDDGAPLLAPPIEMCGLTMDQDAAGAVDLICAAVKDLDNRMRQALVAVSALEKTLDHLPYQLKERADVPELRRVIGEAGRVVRSLRPVSVCRYCALVPRLRKDCNACLGSGWLREHQTRDIPPELDGSQVFERGRLVSVAGLR